MSSPPAPPPPPPSSSSSPPQPPPTSRPPTSEGDEAFNHQFEEVERALRQARGENVVGPVGIRETRGTYPLFTITAFGKLS